MRAEKDFRLTRRRGIILEELRAMRRHPTACELYDAVRKRLPHISLATVYRNLEILCEKGLIRKITTAGRQMLFDIDPRAHYHARCTLCGSIVDMPVAPETVARLLGMPGGPDGFQVTETRIEFLGLCGACLNGGAPARNKV